MIVVDATVLIAFLDGRDAHHEDAKAVLREDDEFGVHTITLAETLVQGVRADRLDEMATAIAGVGIKELGRVSAEPRSLARLRVDTGLKMPDCCVLVAAEGYQAGLATFDARLAAAARERGLVVLGAA